VTKSKLFVVLLLLSYVTVAAVFAGDVGDASSADMAKKGKSMADFVTDAESGFSEPFSEMEVLTVMDASRRLKRQDREFSRKLERIATKMSNLR